MTAAPIAQNPTDSHSVSTTLPFGFLPFACLPTSTPRAVNSRSKAALTSALPTAEQDFPVHTKTWYRMGAVVTGANPSSFSQSSMNVASAISNLASPEAATTANATTNLFSAKRLDSGLSVLPCFEENESAHAVYQK